MGTSDRSSPAGRTHLAVVVVPVLGALVHALRFTGCSVDDAYISFRYAANLARGQGLVFNAGERVEGFSNFLWTLLAAAMLRVGASAPLWMPLVALGALLALVAVTARGVRALADDPAHPGALRGSVAAAVVALSGGLGYHAFAGLETVPFTLAFTVAALAAVQRRPTSFAVVTAVAFLLRPEAGLVGAWGLAVLALGPDGRRRALRATALLALLVGPYLAWKWSYFGALLPNTLHAKTPDRVAGLHYLGAWMASAGGLALLAATGLRRMRFAERALLALVALHTAAVVLEGGDWMLGFRLFLPSLPCLAVVFEAQLRERLAAPGTFAPRAAALLSALAVLLWGAQNVVDGGRIAHVNELQAPQDEAHAALARELRDRGARSVGLHDIGVFGYAAPSVRIADLGALTDTTLARLPGGMGRKHVDDAWLLARNPDLLLFNAFPVGALGDPHPVLRVQWPVERRLMALATFRERYVAECAASIAGYHVALVYRRRDAALAPPPAGALCTTLPAALAHAGRWSASLAAAFSPDD